eukprot:CAMPEP_0167820490 /NCGR_PEP_ID=MMETSP0112_2-20121227/6129_1 /TAXON_ID=91324 /ORGANISM="Lotharella globosa, Strain CCCM811" /LENGTH=737 /DNA_ID=CAMNT_0007721071 /DNA_START=50 /DNA_END=2263 /DNA_ORIENTATION=+
MAARVDSAGFERNHHQSGACAVARHAPPTSRPVLARDAPRRDPQGNTAHNSVVKRSGLSTGNGPCPGEKRLRPKGSTNGVSKGDNGKRRKTPNPTNWKDQEQGGRRGGAPVMSGPKLECKRILHSNPVMYSELRSLRNLGPHLENKSDKSDKARQTVRKVGDWIHRQTPSLVETFLKIANRALALKSMTFVAAYRKLAPSRPKKKPPMPMHKGKISSQPKPGRGGGPTTPQTSRKRSNGSPASSVRLSPSKKTRPPLRKRPTPAPKEQTSSDSKPALAASARKATRPAPITPAATAKQQHAATHSPTKPKTTAAATRAKPASIAKPKTATTPTGPKAAKPNAAAVNAPVANALGSPQNDTKRPQQLLPPPNPHSPEGAALVLGLMFVQEHEAMQYKKDHVVRRDRTRLVALQEMGFSPYTVSLDEVGDKHSSERAPNDGRRRIHGDFGRRVVKRALPQSFRERKPFSQVLLEYVRMPGEYGTKAFGNNVWVEMLPELLRQGYITTKTPIYVYHAEEMITAIKEANKRARNLGRLFGYEFESVEGESNPLFVATSKVHDDLPVYNNRTFLMEERGILDRDRPFLKVRIMMAPPPASDDESSDDSSSDSDSEGEHDAYEDGDGNASDSSAESVSLRLSLRERALLRERRESMGIVPEAKATREARPSQPRKPSVKKTKPLRSKPKPKPTAAAPVRAEPRPVAAEAAAGDGDDDDDDDDSSSDEDVNMLEKLKKQQATKK